MSETEFITRLGKRIYKKRRELKLSRQDLADAVGLKRMQIYRIEKGESPTNIIFLYRIAKSFEIPIEDLLKT